MHELHQNIGMAELGITADDLKSRNWLKEFILKQVSLHPCNTLELLNSVLRFASEPEETYVCSRLKELYGSFIREHKKTISAYFMLIHGTVLNDGMQMSTRTDRKHNKNVRYTETFFIDENLLPTCELEITTYKDGQAEHEYEHEIYSTGYDHKSGRLNAKYIKAVGAAIMKEMHVDYGLNGANTGQVIWNIKPTNGVNRSIQFNPR